MTLSFVLIFTFKYSLLLPFFSLHLFYFKLFCPGLLEGFEIRDMINMIIMRTS